MLDESFVEGGGGFVKDASPIPPAGGFSLSLEWGFVADASPAGGGGFVADASPTPPAVVFSLSLGWSFVADASPAGVVPMPFWSLSAAPNGGLVFSDISGLGFFGVACR